jgi:hypothetical protein
VCVICACAIDAKECASDKTHLFATIKRAVQLFVELIYIQVVLRPTIRVERFNKVERVHCSHVTERGRLINYHRVSGAVVVEGV